MILAGDSSGNDASRLEELRKNINDKEYVHAAVQRIALVLSEGLIGMSRKEYGDEGKRKRGRI